MPKIGKRSPVYRLEHLEPPQSTTVHVSLAFRHWVSNKPLKSFLIAPRVAPAKQKRLVRRRFRTKLCHSATSESDLGWNPVG